MKLEKILVTGAKGQVGGALMELLGDSAIGTTSAELNLLDLDNIKPTLARIAPDGIINPAAYTAVDRAEEEEVSANVINALAVEKLAQYAFENDIPFIHYSTDYVFAGDGENKWREDDKCAPINAYGRTKLAGEEAIRAVAGKYDNPKWLILRTSWVYNEVGQNFVNTMLRLGKEREVLSIICDQIGAATYAGDIALYTLKILDKALEKGNFPSGIYHLCNSGETSWHGFAEEIFRNASANGVELEVKELREIGTKDYPTPAARPHNSRLDMTKLQHEFGLTTPDWKDALKRSMADSC